MSKPNHTLATKFATFERQFGAKPGDFLYVHAAALAWLSPPGAEKLYKLLVELELVCYAGLYVRQGYIFLPSDDMLLVIRNSDPWDDDNSATNMALREIAMFGFTIITKASFPELQAQGVVRNVVMCLKELPSIELCPAPA